MMGARDSGASRPDSIRGRWTEGGPRRRSLVPRAIASELETTFLAMTETRGADPNALLIRLSRSGGFGKYEPHFSSLRGTLFPVPKQSPPLRRAHGRKRSAKE